MLQENTNDENENQNDEEEKKEESESPKKPEKPKEKPKPQDPIFQNAFEKYFKNINSRSIIQHIVTNIIKLIKSTFSREHEDLLPVSHTRVIFCSFTILIIF